jgi:antitoxin component YwqK of YwqJK toxin-antitoxin module
MNRLFLLLLIAIPALLHAQKTEEGYDIQFKPTKDAPRYYVVTEQKNGYWYREAYYLPEKTLAMQGRYKDEKCQIEDSTFVMVHPNKKIKSSGSYINGKKEGVWLEYHENGMMKDSAFYDNGHLQGISLGWNEQGYQVDSSNFDGKGNGVKVHWFANGPVSITGRIINDTTAVKRWVHYHPNGQKLAVIDYDDNGKQIKSECFTETGEKLESCVEMEAHFPGEETEWIKFLQKNLDAAVPVRNRAPVGMYKTMIQFVVNTDGRLTEFKPLTNFGYGMEQEVIRMLRASPKWVPALQYGRKVKAYRKQPVTFKVVSR